MSINGKDSNAFSEGLFLAAGSRDFGESRAHVRGPGLAIVQGWNLDTSNDIFQGWHLDTEIGGVSPEGETKGAVFVGTIAEPDVDQDFARFPVTGSKLQSSGIYGAMVESDATNDVSSLGLNQFTFRLVDTKGNKYTISPPDIHAGFTPPLPAGILAGSTGPQSLLVPSGSGTAIIFDSRIIMGGTKPFYVEFEAILPVTTLFTGPDTPPIIELLQTLKVAYRSCPFSLTPPTLFSPTGPGGILIH